jgi:spore coat protein U-like protein
LEKNMFAIVLAAHRPGKPALLAATALAVMTASAPGLSADARATASATIVAPITISNATNLSFGAFDASRTGTITVDTAGGRTANGVAFGGGSPSAASFSIGGQSGLCYNIVYTGTSATLSNGPDTLSLAIFSDLGGAPTSSGVPVSSGTLGAGPTTLRVGAILTVNSAGTPAGTYNGTISVGVEYQ